MKKTSILSAFLGLGLLGSANAADITIYYSPSCPHCHHAREFMEQHLIYEYPALTVTEVNVTNPANREMFVAALKKCEYESGGVPVILVGEKCFQGYADFMSDELREAVEVDLSDSDKENAKTVQAEMEKDAGAYRSAHTENIGKVSEYDAPKAEAKKK